MSFATSRTETTVFGNKRVFMCDFVSDSGTTGGDITTGLSTVERVLFGHKGSSVVASAPVYNETLPLTNTGGVVTIVTVADTAGTFMAIGV